MTKARCLLLMTWRTSRCFPLIHSNVTKPTQWFVYSWKRAARAERWTGRPDTGALRPDLTPNFTDTWAQSSPMSALLLLFPSLKFPSNYTQFFFFFLNWCRTDTSSGVPHAWERTRAGWPSYYKPQHPWTGHSRCHHTGPRRQATAWTIPWAWAKPQKNQEMWGLYRP